MSDPPRPLKLPNPMPCQSMPTVPRKAAPVMLFNNITGAAFLGTVGMDWQGMGFGNFSGLGGSDMILRNVNTGGVEVYDISNNQITGAAFMGTVGLNWQFSGVGNFSGLGETDMLLRDSISGGLVVFDLNKNQI